MGDRLIVEISRKLIELVSDFSSIIANFGSDTFVIVSDKMTATEHVALLVERIQSIFRSPLVIRGNEIYLTVSIGVSIYPNDGRDAMTLLKKASVALTQVEKQGGNDVLYCTESLQEQASYTIRIENGLRRALAENQFKLYYQPKVDLLTGRIVGVEALLRWQDPVAGLQLPSSFIPIAEDSELIVSIGKWILFEIGYHFPLFARRLPVAVNISAKHFRKQYDIVGFITNISSSLAISPEFLEIEITESVLLDDFDRGLEVLTEFKKLGFSVAIDDFGTGYSSFDYVRRIQPNRIKIDKSFIDPLESDASAVKVVRAIIAMAKALGITTTAEGVETAGQVKILRAEGCDEIQGFYFGKPMSLYELNELITSSPTLKLPE